MLRKRTFRKALRSKGVWLSAEEALVIERALWRARVMTTEPGADVIKRFMQRCKELKDA